MAIREFVTSFVCVKLVYRIKFR